MTLAGANPTHIKHTHTHTPAPEPTTQRPAACLKGAGLVLQVVEVQLAAGGALAADAAWTSATKRP